jgi:hypothetical protein
MRFPANTKYRDENNLKYQLNMVVHAFNSSIPEAEAGS